MATGSGRADLDVLLERLRTRKLALEKRISRVSADRRRSKGALDPDFAEQAVQRENDEVLDALSEAEHKEITMISAALKRIDAGSFGLCDECGADIDRKRLEALPSAAYCIECAEAREEEAARS